MVLCLFYKLVKKQHGTYDFDLVWGLLNSQALIGHQVRTWLGLKLGPQLLPRLIPQFLPQLMPWFGWFPGGVLLLEFQLKPWCGLQLGSPHKPQLRLYLIPWRCWFSSGVCLIRPGLELRLEPQLRPRHRGFLESFFNCKIKSNVVFCFTWCFVLLFFHCRLLLPLF